MLQYLPSTCIFIYLGLYEYPQLHHIRVDTYYYVLLCRYLVRPGQAGVPLVVSSVIVRPVNFQGILLDPEDGPHLY